jgi:hypothetical protein
VSYPQVVFAQILKGTSMSLLQEIQESVIQEGTEIGPVLLKLRLLAARLGSAELGEWVEYESEG